MYQIDINQKEMFNFHLKISLLFIDNLLILNHLIIQTNIMFGYIIYKYMLSTIYLHYYDIKLCERHCRMFY